MAGGRDYGGAPATRPTRGERRAPPPPLCPRPGDPPPDHRTAHRRHDGRAHWQATTTGVAAIRPSRPQDGPWTPQPGGLDPTAATRGYSRDSTAVLSNS